MNSLQRLHEHGQSFWLDNLTRGMIRDGELARRIAEQGLRGVTSNPAIFEQAIGDSDAYDEEIARLGAEGLSVEEIYDRVTVGDVRAACDLLRPVYEESGGADGFVSLEVSPHLAHDADRTVAEARRLWEAVERPNALIKIPGTPAGVPAIRESLFEGVNVNVTLLFSIGAYEAVAEAYLDALERRLDAGRPVDPVASVASFFLSRIDTMVDRELDLLRDSADGEAAEELASLRGRAAVANAKLAYRRFRGLLSSDRWRSLAARGAHPQRMLWASTSTKDPSYPDVKYVEPLIGPLTVNTMPERTIEAFLDHGTVAPTVEEDVAEAERVMERLAAAGIDFEAVTDALLSEGVEKFVTPHDRLLESLRAARDALLASGSTA